MRIAIIGAGFAGLSAAKVLTGFGHQVAVFEKAPDVGGVWSRIRRYPGLSAQNNKASYSFSDFPMPSSYPEWPSGEQVQLYLADYVQRFGLGPALRLSTEVLHADLDRVSGQWTLRTKYGYEEEVQGPFEHLVVANGVFCDPLMPDYDGAEEFRAAGGRLCHSSEFIDHAVVENKEVVVVGYGKSACDLAGALSGVANSTTVVARELMWKMPKRLGGVLNYKYLVLTRLGEALFPYVETRGMERFLHGRAGVVLNALVNGLQWATTRQLKLAELGLIPDGTFRDIARSTISLATDGFYDRVRTGQIVVHRGCVITRLLARDGRAAAELSTGEIVGADVVICGTGFRQRVPFLAEDLQEELTDESGNFELYRQILPHTVPRLVFAGYNSSLFSPLSAEIAAVWIASYLSGAVPPPPLEARRAFVQKRLRWMEQRTCGHHARGTNIIPFSMHNIDEMLSDLGTDVSRATRLKQWLLPIDPRAYREITSMAPENQRR